MYWKVKDFKWEVFYDLEFDIRFYSKGKTVLSFFRENNQRYVSYLCHSSLPKNELSFIWFVFGHFVSYNEKIFVLLQKIHVCDNKWKSNTLILISSLQNFVQNLFFYSIFLKFKVWVLFHFLECLYQKNHNKITNLLRNLSPRMDGIRPIQNRKRSVEIRTQEKRSRTVLEKTLLILSPAFVHQAMTIRGSM